MLKIFLSFLLFCYAPFAIAKKKDIELSAKSKKILAKINESLTNISDMKVGFRQVFQENEETGYAEFKKDFGIFIKYKTMPVTLLANKDITVYFDSKMEQKSELPTQNSATQIFTGNLQINEEMFDIISVKENREAYFITATVKRMKAEGLITMYFSKKDILLRRVDIKNAEGNVLRVDLYSHTFNSISPERFKAINIEKETLEA